MTNEQKIREIYPLIPKTDKINLKSTIFINYNDDGKEYFILSSDADPRHDYIYFNEI